MGASSSAMAVNWVLPVCTYVYKFVYAYIRKFVAAGIVWVWCIKLPRYPAYR